MSKYYNRSIFFLIALIVSGCSFQPLYKSNDFYSSYKINVIVKSKGKYENNVSLVKRILESKLNTTKAKPSHLKLVVSINRYESDLGINKNLYTFGKMLILDVNYSFYDKKGLLSSGKLSSKTSYNITSNTYSNIVSKEDASKKLALSTSKNLVNLIIARDFDRKISP